MGQPINIVAQTCMDWFYQNYKQSSDYFTLEDFITYCANTVANIYQQDFDRQRAEIRQEKKDGLVSFDPSWLNEQILKVDYKDGEWVAKLDQPIASFLTDSQTAGLQFVLVTKPGPETELERLPLGERWQLALAPFVNKIFFTPYKDRIVFTKKGNCNVNYVRVFFVPAIGPTMEVPDGIVDMVVTNTAVKMKQIKDGTIVKKTQDGQQNTTLQTEMNLEALKP